MSGVIVAVAGASRVLVFEVNAGQMVEDVRLALNGKVPVDFYGRAGGNVPSVEEIHSDVLGRMTQQLEREMLGRMMTR